jgi:LysM repeat protein
MGIKSSYFKAMLATFFWVASFVALGQNAQVTENGKTYLLHTVQKGQTLYAISKTYSISVEDIKAANPEIADNGIKIDQNIRIPVKAIDKKQAKKSDITLKGDTIFHEVLKKETIYALTKKYEISEQRLKELNPALADGLKVGMTLVIVGTPPQPETYEEGDFLAQVYALPTEDSLILHEVQPLETLYGLSKKYNVNADSIQIVNNGLPEGLKVGTTIRIPKPNPR